MDTDRQQHDEAATDSPVPTPGVGRDALGMGPAPASAPPGAAVDPTEELVPGAGFEEHPLTEAKPWHTSLAFESSQAGVGNDPPDSQPPAHEPPPEDREPS